MDAPGMGYAAEGSRIIPAWIAGILVGLVYNCLSHASAACQAPALLPVRNFTMTTPAGSLGYIGCNRDYTRIHPTPKGDKE